MRTTEGMLNNAGEVRAGESRNRMRFIENSHDYNYYLVEQTPR